MWNFTTLISTTELARVVNYHFRNDEIRLEIEQDSNNKEIAKIFWRKKEERDERIYGAL